MSTLTKEYDLTVPSALFADFKNHVRPLVAEGVARFREAARVFKRCLLRRAAELASIVRARVGAVRPALEVGRMHRVEGISFPIVPSRFDHSFGDEEALGILRVAIERHLGRALGESETFDYVPLYSRRDHWLNQWGWRWNQGLLVAIYERGDVRLAVHLELEAPSGDSRATPGGKLYRWRAADYRTVIRRGFVYEITYEEDPPF